MGKWVERPLVNISPELVPFWEGLQRHEFRLCRCTKCDTHYFPFTICIHHADIPEFDEMVWSPSSGHGKVFAKVVVHQVRDPDYQAEVPYVLALVELDEGPLFSTRIVDCLPSQVRIGSEVAVLFYDVPEAGHTLPVFALTAGSEEPGPESGHLTPVR